MPKRKDWKYPEEVIYIGDNGGETIDRYTVIYNGNKYPLDHPYAYRGKWHWILGMNDNPADPQGFCQHSTLDHWDVRRLVESTEGRKQKIRFDELPEVCQKALLADLTQD